MITLDDFKKLELRIAEVLSAAVHPQADRLLILRIRIGEEERTIVAGMRKFYSETELVGKKIVVVTNLEPAQIRGVTSEGTLPAASPRTTGSHACKGVEECVELFPKGSNLEATAVKPWCGVHSQTS